MRIGIFAATSVLVATAATAVPPGEQAATRNSAAAAATQSPSADSAAEADEEKKICRTERATGSLTRRTRVCLTAAQWREVNSRTYKGVTEMQGSASGSQAIANNPGAGG